MTDLAMAGLVAACVPHASERAQARNDFNALCVDCHGPDGRGGGPAAVGMTPAPVRLVALMEYVKAMQR